MCASLSGPTLMCMHDHLSHNACSCGYKTCVCVYLYIYICTCIYMYIHGVCFRLAIFIILHGHDSTCVLMYMYICRLMRRRIKVADPRIFLIYAAYMHIREEVVDEYHYEHTAVRYVPGVRVVLDC